ncbi:MAG TPA: AtpZ/AtpI family protein [Prolixibacteraceae bacterium]|jgi:F0F1-type ATP synthase assembly protein I|nr:AtpZ/AtpI family protein [Prolixibacteraceae bacterium]HPR84629.1 AtpZ/AtpI family protein [Prolixibacteraceae bacterium]
MDSNLKEPKKKFDDFIRYSNLAFEMVAIMGIGTWVGWLIDNWVETKFPIFLIVFMVLSVIGSIFYAIRKFL